MTTKHYRTIVADPPWQFKTTLAVTGNAPGRTKQHGRSGTDYSTLSIAEITALPVAQLASESASLFLWTTNTHLEFAPAIIRAWGFDYKNTLTWCKPPKGMIGFGTFSQSSEFIVYAERGKHERLVRCPTTWFQCPRSGHSRKPEAFLDLVEQVSPGPYLELFARRNRFGWDTWGNECFEHVELGGAA